MAHLKLMRPLVAIIILEFLFTGSVTALSSQKISRVLGIQIAQVDATQIPPTEAPAAESVAPTESPVVNPPPTGDIVPTTPTDSSLPSSIDTISPTDTQDLFNQEVVYPSQIPQDQPLKPTGANPPPSTEEVNQSIQTTALLNPSESINSPDSLNNQSVAEVKKEEEQLSLVNDPAQQTSLLISFATDKVKDMTSFSKTNDFASTDFAASRFNNQIDQAIQNLDRLGPKDQAKFKEQLVNFCFQADRVLRTVQLSVPEESEQDIEIARGQCRELQP